MIKDIEGHVIRLSEKPNGHLLVLGRSGTGKTYFVCRMIEAQHEKGHRVLVLDYSSSYTSDELDKNHFRYKEQLLVINPYNEEGSWSFRGNDFADEFTEALLHALGICSYYQRTLLKEAVHMLQGQEVTIPAVFRELEILLKKKEMDESSRTNIGHLLTRLEPLRSIGKICFKEMKECALKKTDKSIIILQLSDFSEGQRRFLAVFLAELIWREARYGNRRADIVVFDEFQNLKIKDSGAVVSILREGRKFGISAWLSSQCIGNCDKQAIETLMQAGNMIFFKPTEKEIREIAGWISPREKRVWMELLDKLEVGQAVLKGNFQFVPNLKTCSTPVICRIE